MPYRLNLRYRIFFTYPLLGFLISVLVIVFFIFSFDLLERQYMDNFLLEELDHFIENSTSNPELTEQHASHWEIYKIDDDHPFDLLNFLSQYSPGTYDVELRGQMYDIGIAERDGARYYILYNDQDAEALEINLIAFMVASACVIIWAATAYGLWFSKRVLKPVMSLADEVRTLDLGAAEAIEVDSYAQDEVGFLASEFDSYINRIRRLIEREREFTANASHELRTPLTIIKAATEALLLRQNLPEDIRTRLLRIERAVNEMNNCLQVLLILSREPDRSQLLTDSTDLVRLVEQLLEDYESLRPPAVKIVKHFAARPVIKAQEAMLSIVLCNVIKNAFSNTVEGAITIEIDDHRLTLTDTGKGIPQECLPQVVKRGYKDRHSEGQGLGLSLVQRICDYYQWRLSIDSISGQGTTVMLEFAPVTPDGYEMPREGRGVY
ncbi:HAMP domain-containing sensor histidine kinase [Methylomarinum sp. Ch1-1]|uniref:histidine kinase n=1 Tax=Methylomarinum roseum TaxID=3067653 RepID=A0AAU7NZN7_9GAMM|nr:HAMP domain-containing sensor histidine kinase [Methylomarinum sp. Ch1-1]MDP4521519.1 HAMP domain-containing sensor histidine kinase [Methylomarinum sp. Ch1-1]